MLAVFTENVNCAGILDSWSEEAPFPSHVPRVFLACLILGTGRERRNGKRE